jgi:hypothetical protein
MIVAFRKLRELSSDQLHQNRVRALFARRFTLERVPQAGRGLHGVRLIISDACTGTKAGISSAGSANWPSLAALIQNE